MPDVGDDTHHGPPGTFGPPDGDAAADRVAAAKISPDEGLIDQRDWSAALIIGVVSARPARIGIPIAVVYPGLTPRSAATGCWSGAAAISVHGETVFQVLSAQRKRRRRPDAGEFRPRGDRVEQPRVERVHGGRVGKAGRRQDDAEGEPSLRVEALVDVLEVHEAAGDEARTCEQAERHGDLRDDNRCAEALVRPVSGCRARAHPRPENPRVACSAGKSPNTSAAHERHHTRDGHDRHHEPDVGHPWNRVGSHRAQQVEEQHRQNDSGGSANRVEDERLDDKLPDQSSSAGAERRTHENFPSSLCEARQQEARDIAARDQQHEQDGGA